MQAREGVASMPAGSMAFSKKMIHGGQLAERYGIFEKHGDTL
jgi:hypothetical protein